MKGANIATYNLQVFTPEPEADAPSLSEDDKRVLSNLPAMLEVLEEELEKVLPEGYAVRITEWNR